MPRVRKPAPPRGLQEGRGAGGRGRISQIESDRDARVEEALSLAKKESRDAVEKAKRDELRRYEAELQRAEARRAADAEREKRQLQIDCDARVDEERARFRSAEARWRAELEQRAAAEAEARAAAVEADRAQRLLEEKEALEGTLGHARRADAEAAERAMNAALSEAAERRKRAVQDAVARTTQEARETRAALEGELARERDARRADKSQFESRVAYGKEIPGQKDAKLTQLAGAVEQGRARGDVPAPVARVAGVGRRVGAGREARGLSS